MARVKLGDVARESRETIKNGKKGLPIVGLEHLTPGEITLIQWDEGTDNTFTKAFHKGQMLFGRRRAYLKKAAVAPFDGICSGDITVIEAIPDKLSTELLPFIIQNDNFFEFAMEKSAGSLSPRAKWEHLQHFEINLPSINEQRKLTELLWAMNDTREVYKKLLTITDEMVKARFIEMFGDFLSDKTYYRELNEVCDFIDYRGKTPVKANSGIPLITAKNVRENSFSIEPQEFIPEENYDTVMSRGFPKYNDILFTTEAPLGNVCRIPSIYERFCVGQRLITMQPKSCLTSEYLERALLSQSFRDEMLRHSSGSTVTGIRSKELVKLMIPVPPIILQKRFSNFIQQADKSKLELKRTLDELESVYKSMLHEIFG